MSVKIPSPYTVVEYRGKPMLNADKAMVMKMENRLGYALSVTQAIGDAPDSAGYHAKGRMLDLVHWDEQNKLRVAKDCGNAGWIRDSRDDMSEHLHLAVIFGSRTNEKGISHGGFSQIAAFDRGENGLVGGAPDRNPYRPSPKALLTLDEYRFIILGGLELPQPTPVTRMRDAMAEAMHELTVAIHEAKSAVGRPVAQSTGEDLKKDRRSIRERLENLPKR